MGKNKSDLDLVEPPGLPESFDLSSRLPSPSECCGLGFGDVSCVCGSLGPLKLIRLPAALAFAALWPTVAPPLPAPPPAAEDGAIGVPVAEVEPLSSGSVTEDAPTPTPALLPTGPCAEPPEAVPPEAAACRKLLTELFGAAEPRPPPTPSVRSLGPWPAACCCHTLRLLRRKLAQQQARAGLALAAPLLPTAALVVETLVIQALVAEQAVGLEVRVGIFVLVGKRHAGRLRWLAVPVPTYQSFALFRSCTSAATRVLGIQIGDRLGPPGIPTPPPAPLALATPVPPAPPPSGSVENSPEHKLFLSKALRVCAPPATRLIDFVFCRQIRMSFSVDCTSALDLPALLVNKQLSDSPGAGPAPDAALMTPLFRSSHMVAPLPVMSPKSLPYWGEISLS
uniref:Uncharacterized protein n=1 Tax=Anopheles atroparvus TaxID=41427 RepID=A0A182IX44_ANOAO